MTMQPTHSTPPESLLHALSVVVRRPLETIAPPWSWKAAACSAIVRALGFFLTNLSSGRGNATKAMLVEAVFAVFAGGLIGALSQHLRHATPTWMTGLLICVVLPGMMTVAQFGVHHVAGTQHQSSGLVVSFGLAGLAAAYTWYAMRHGAMLGGVEETTVRHDLRVLPRLSLNFVLAGPRAMLASLRAFSSGQPTTDLQTGSDSRRDRER